MEDGLRILLLEDVPEEAKLIERVIRKENIPFSCKRVDSREQFAEGLKSFMPHLVLSDHALPQFNSIEALKLAKVYDPDMPFILVTGAVSEEFAVTCLKQGAYDYVLKSNLSRLPSSIKQALLQREAQVRKKEAEQELTQQNIKLVQSNQDLLKTNRELDNFVYSVSHNLRGPLSSILGVVNLSRIASDVDPADLFLKIEDSVKKLDETLNEIVDYSRNARAEKISTPVDLRAIFDHNVEKLRYLPHAENIDYRLTMECDKTAHSDPYRINLIIHNLLSNSIKYCDPQKHDMVVSLIVSCSDSLCLRFEDNGVGISDHAMPRIFDMFYRGNVRSDGAGLGLYIAREAIEKLQGTIDVLSTENVGTTFVINLPIHDH
jgi:signal transduction histidine kinase